MNYLLQENGKGTSTKPELLCPLQCQVSIDALTGKITFCDSVLPPYGKFAEPFTQAKGAEGWTKEFIETVFSLKKGESFEVMVSGGFIYPVNPRWWVYPAKTCVKEYVYPLLRPTRIFRIIAIGDSYYAKKELEYRQRRALAIANGAS
jgi:hypothetical protein